MYTANFLNKRTTVQAESGTSPVDDIKSTPGENQLNISLFFKCLMSGVLLKEKQQ